MKFQTLSLLLSGLLLVGCQSARVPALLPAVQEYGQSLNHQLISPASQATEPPQLLADASAATPSQERSRRLPPAVQIKLAKPVNIPSKQIITAPDTAVTPTVAQASKPDPETTTVNLIGGAISLSAIIGALVAFNAEFSSGWTNIGLLLISIALFPVGIALLLYQGENGRLRLRRQARRKERRTAKVGVGSEPKEEALVSKKSRLIRIGSVLFLAGALVTAAAYLLGGYAILFFGLPGIILAISGLVAIVAAL
ncbi:hypothetical protein [Hymenobacter sp. DG01]|uniref:hypothetical protein n=1 Tax=Hymenobacter sp. DG01 TaxID=2584940 RepID=UPI0011220A9E|nr:hypothetical protein [Hymenobacter sp. DG01]